MAVVHVLVVDDDEDDFLIVRDRLEAAMPGQVEVVWNDTLEKGLQTLREGKADVCLVDQVLGPERGLDLLRLAAEAGIDTPIILLTGNGTRELDEEALAAGAWDFLVKGSLDPEGVARSVRYVVESARAQAQIEQSRAQFARLLEDVHDAIFVVDQDGVVKYSNKMATKLFWRAQGALLGERMPHWDEISRNAGKLVELSAGSGRTLLVEPQLSETEWEGRQARLVLLRDLTDDRRQREQLSLLERAIEASFNGVVICDARRDGLPLVFANPAFEQITGYLVSESIGRNMRFLQGAERNQPEVERLRSCLAEGAKCDVVIRNFRKNGTPFWNHLSIAPVRNTRGDVTHFIGIQHDVTAQMERGQEFSAS